MTRDTNFHMNFAYLFITSNYIIFKRSGWGEGGVSDQGGKYKGGCNQGGKAQGGKWPGGKSRGGGGGGMAVGSSLDPAQLCQKVAVYLSQNYFHQIHHLVMSSPQPSREILISLVGRP